MKTILILLNLLSSYKIVWENTYLQIPLNENTHIYYEMPRAIAYDRYDNVVNTEVYYERGVNHTTLKVVNSLHVKTFKIDYKATFPLIGKESIETIQFEIIDKIEPVFLHIPEISMPVKSKKKTEKEIIEDLIFEDNYYKNEELIIKVRGLDGVNVNYPGDYLITYEIIDPSFNVKKEERYYHVYNNIPPEIKIKQPLKLEYGAKFNYDDYFIFSDTFNSLIDINIDVSKIDFDKLGFYELKINLINEALLTVSEIFHFEIVDTTKPILIVKDKLEFNYQDKIDLKSLIVLVSDNYDKLTKDDVIITGYYDFERLGKYEITYEVNDNSLNKTVLKISFTIVDLTKPEIELLVDEIIINVYDEVINYQ